MGCFSWCTSDTRKSIPCWITAFGDLPGTVYLLNPFGEPYKETNYEGYGEFGGRDVYELVVEWNRQHLTPDNIVKPERSSWESGERGDVFFASALNEYNVACAAIKEYAAGASDEYMKEQYGAQLGYAGYADDWKRCLGIKIACYDEQHVKLKYPIKIVEHPVAYEKAGISPSCPFQGWLYPGSMTEIQREVREAFEELAACEQRERQSSLEEKIRLASDYGQKAAKEQAGKDEPVR